MAFHNELGKRGEQVALNHLEKKGYEILNVNWRYKHKEVDIITTDGNFIVFVEVKTRSSIINQHPREAVGSVKINYLVDAASKYIQQFNIDKEVRFDIISVIINKEDTIVEHITSAFYPPMA